MFGQATYLALLLPWIAPIVALHWWVGGDVLLARWRQVVIPTLFGGLYLSLMDRVALGAGIWEIALPTSTGVLIAGLPLEELLFFLLTALVVSQSVTLLIADELSLTEVMVRVRARWDGLLVAGPRFLRGAFDGFLAAGVAFALTLAAGAVGGATPGEARGLVYLAVATILGGVSKLNLTAAVVAACTAAPLLFLWVLPQSGAAIALLLAIAPFVPWAMAQAGGGASGLRRTNRTAAHSE